MLAVLIDLILPRRCVGCGRPGVLLCERCVPTEGAVAVGGVGVATAAAAAYDGAVRQALLRYKERGRRDLGPPLGALLAVALAELGNLPGAVLVPVPSSRGAAARRGGDHVLRLARRAASRSGYPVVRALALRRTVADSAGLDTAQRAANLAGAMAARAPQVAGCPAIVVDDIATTGATLREAARALAAAGWAVGGAAVVAATPRRRSLAIGTAQSAG